MKEKNLPLKSSLTSYFSVSAPNNLAPVDRILSRSKSSNNAQLSGSSATIKTKKKNKNKNVSNKNNLKFTCS